ncbi:hypothetical protein V2J09_013910 [Rumex salicifolius]
MGDRSMWESEDQQMEIEFKMKKKSKKSNKRRFSEDQVRWLETMFQNEAKLEPRQKAEVAAQLGLQPRQVAIWFQNKRARWKSRQLQHDFDALRRDYDALATRFDLLERENHSLSLQLQNLKESAGNIQEQSYKAEDVVNDQSESNAAADNDNDNDDKKPGLSKDKECDHTKQFYFGAMAEPTCSSLTSSDEEWHGLQSDGLFDQSPSSCQWWDFWP